MHILYLDASGTPELQDKSKHYVLAGVAVHESDWRKIVADTAVLIASYRHGTRPFELHAKELLDNIPEQAAIPDFASLSRDDRRTAIEAMRSQTLANAAGKDKPDLRKRFNGTANVIHLTLAERTACYEQALNLIANIPVRLFCSANDKAHNFRMSGMRDINEQAFMQVVSRFDYYVKFMNERSGIAESSMLVIDRDDAKEDALKKLTVHYRTQGHPHGVVESVIEHPFFADSGESVGIQMADLVAYVVRRYVEHQTTPACLTNLQRIWKKFDCSSNAVMGVRHYSKRECPCYICEKTGRI